MKNTRREFIENSGMALLTAFGFVGFGHFITGCGKDNGSQAGTTPAPPENSSQCERNGTVSFISDPTHQLNVSKEDVILGAPKSYHIQGRANHDHVVTLSTENFDALRSNQSIVVNSGISMGPVASHFHQIRVSCA